MAVNEKTSPKVAKIASKVLFVTGDFSDSDIVIRRIVTELRSKKTASLTIGELKTLAGSCLTQATDKPKKK